MSRPGSPGPVIVSVVCMVSAAWILVGCAPGREVRVPVDADEYIAGVQYRDTTGLVKRSAGFRAALSESPVEEWDGVREEFLALSQARLEEFQDSKESGVLPLAADGIDIIQGLAIGKGIYYRFDDIHLEDDGATAVGILEVTPGYGPRRMRGLPSGTRIYLMGDPFGTLTTLVLGERDEEQTLRVVERLRLEWRFSWFDAVDVYPEGWAVESVRLVPGSVVMTELRGVF